MRRSRSPVRYISREKSREKSFSISSLSDCSLGKSPKRYSTKRSDNGSRQGKHREDRFYKNENNYEKEYDGGKKQSRSRSRDTESRLFKNDNKGRHYKEKVYSSGSSTFQKNADDGVAQKYKHSESCHKVRERKKPDDRIERLEQMVELLVSTKSGHIRDTPAPSALNRYEFNPRDTTFTTSMWLNKINEDCLERNYGEKECIEYTQSKMTGLIKAWFKTLDLFDYTWPEIKMLIINTFPDNVDFAATLRLLVNRLKKPEETITQYYFSKMYLLEACKITGANAVSVLIDGLSDPYWQQDARVHNFQNPEVFYTEFLSKLPSFGLQHVSQENYQQAHVEQIHHLPQAHVEYVEVPYEIPIPHKHPEIVEDLRQNIGTSRLGKLSRKETIRKCYNCYGLGHIAAKCPQNSKCYLCNKPGHVAARCPTAEDRGPY